MNNTKRKLFTVSCLVLIASIVLGVTPTTVLAKEKKGQKEKREEKQERRVSRKSERESKPKFHKEHREEDREENFEDFWEHRLKFSKRLKPHEEACRRIPPGHFIAPGFIKKNGLLSNPCQILPPGIFKKFPRFGTTTPDTTAPVISSIAVLKASTTSVLIEWQTNEPATSEVMYGTTTAYGKEIAKRKLVTLHRVRLYGLSPNTLYHYKVQSKDSAGNTVLSGDLTFTTTNPSNDTATPVILNVTVSNISTSTARLTWNTSEPATSEIAYGTTTAYGNMKSNLALTATHEMNLADLLPNTLYHFTLSGRDGSGNIGTTTDRTFTTAALIDTLPPIISAIVVGNIGSTTAAISWNTDEAATGKIYFSTTTPIDFGAAGTTTNSLLTLDHLFTLSNLTARTAYYFALESKDASNNTATSSEGDFTTLAP